MPPLRPLPADGQPRRVAVLGGGVGGLTAALELTRPCRRGQFEVTVHQLGWRLGGKGASGRAMDRGARIEEHGLHIWFGFYENAFRLMGEVYAEAGRPDDVPLSTVEEAFTACPTIVAADRFHGRWHLHPTTFPAFDGKPWEPHRKRTIFHIMSRFAGWLAEAHDGSPGTESTAIGAARDQLERARAAADELALVEGIDVERATAGLARIAQHLRDAADAVAGTGAASLEGVGVMPRLRLFYTTLDAFAALAHGIAADDLLRRGFAAINGEDWACWLRRHGASRRLTVGEHPTDWAPAVRGVYDVAFAFPGGDVDHPDAAAGTATSDLLRLLGTYPGQVAYKMNAGMGDAIMAPIYEVLRKRGVTFRFFHAVTALSAAAGEVDRIDMVRQVDLGDEEYHPLVDVAGLPCWPNAPLWEQLPAEAKGCGTRFETELDPLCRKQAGSLTLRRGQDFDDVVLAIPAGALADLCPSLVAADRSFAQMVEVVGSATVRTQAFQVWTTRSSADLGWTPGPASVAPCFVEPLDTFCDMSHLLHSERWEPADGVKGVTYVCGVLDDRDGETAEAATDRVRRNAVEYLTRDIGAFWPEAEPWGWDVLADPEGRSGEERFGAQYWRANTAAWERYVLTPSGSVDKRLPSGESGFVNLVLAGDWTRNGIDAGCVEAAVMSGIRAGYALTGDTSAIPGEEPEWLTTT